VTTIESPHLDRPGDDAIPLADDVALVLDPFVARTLPLVTARLRERHPSVSAEVVEHHVNLAAARLTKEARIHDYLPILIERTASGSLRRAYA